MRIKCHVLDLYVVGGNEGGDSGVLVAVTCSDGAEEHYVVDRDVIYDDEADIGYLSVCSEGDKVLVETVERSTSGRARIWVKKSALVQSS